tara:strand:+ start:2437 stop:2742 length:306 start_codon:yes stop_codon:yes gene_type:complete
MIITIKNDEGVTTNFDINLISDEQKKQEATVIVQKVGNLQVTIEALDFASRTHRANLEQLLVGCDEAVVETERARNDKGQFVGDDPSTLENESVVTKDKDS